MLLREKYTHHEPSFFDHQIKKQHSNIEENSPMPGVTNPSGIPVCRLFIPRAW